MNLGCSPLRFIYPAGLQPTTYLWGASCFCRVLRVMDVMGGIDGTAKSGPGHCWELLWAVAACRAPFGSGGDRTSRS